MQCKARLVGISNDILTGNYNVTLAVNDKTILDEVNDLQDKDLSLKLTNYTKKRSLDANAYYWSLLPKIAEKLKVSVPFLHNHYLRQCGYVDTEMWQRINGYPITTYLPDNEETQKEIDEDLYNHFLPTNQIISSKQGLPLRGYYLLKGSHEFNTQQMARLIDFLVADCKQYGIQTITPEEIRKMYERYGKKVGIS